MKPLSISLLICGLVHCMPVIGILGTSWLNKLYGVEDMSANLTLLMQHRALMFGLLGAVFFYGAFNVRFQWFAASTGIVSMLGFILLVGFNNPEPKLHKVVLIDCAVLVALIASMIWQKRRDTKA